MRFISALLTILLCWFSDVPVWAGTITLVQAQSNNIVDAGGTTVAVTLPGAITQGNFIGCGVAYSSGDTVNITSVADGSNTYAVSATSQQSTALVDVGIAHALNITGGAAPTITLTLTGNAAGRGIICGEFKGVKRSGALDQAAGQVQDNPGTGTDAVSSGNVTTTQHQELILGMTCCGLVPGSGIGTNFALVDADQTWDAVLEYRVVQAIGAYAATYTATLATDDFGTRVATFRGCVEMMGTMGIGGC